MEINKLSRLLVWQEKALSFNFYQILFVGAENSKKADTRSDLSITSFQPKNV